uniref:Ubiquitin-like domain-containing protein n=1 Tax=Timema genevievae TaxID=629358 RepID=A0A7R9K3E8_TIMGE|nr:unnamed protein product [Timema genevievae]
MDNSGNAGSSTEPPKASGATTAEPVSNRSGCGCSSSTKITVRVTPTTGGQFDLQVAKTESVENLKKFISKKLKVPKERICLLHRDSFVAMPMVRGELVFMACNPLPSPIPPHPPGVVHSATPALLIFGWDLGRRDLVTFQSIGFKIGRTIPGTLEGFLGSGTFQLEKDHISYVININNVCKCEVSFVTDISVRWSQG